MGLISKVELKYQLEKMGIQVEGNYIRKSAIVSIIANDESKKLGFKIKQNYNKIMYHGSPKPINNWHVNTEGQFGKGLYLTEDRNLASFYSKGGKQGSAHNILKDEQYVYKFIVKGRAFILEDIENAVNELINEIDDASDGYQDAGGDYNHKRVTKFFAEYAADYHNCQLIVLPKSVKNCDLLTPQALILDPKAFQLVDVVHTPES